nr:hypothetical protein [Tanacetum cinerariifolium]
MHNNIMATGSRDRPSMLAPGRYPQWCSWFLRYVDTRPNGEALRKCILSGPYNPTTVLVHAVKATDNSPSVPEHMTEMWEAIERLQQGEPLNIQDVKTNLFWEFRKFTSHDGESMESYYTRFYKLMNEMIRNNLTVTTMQQYQNEVNELHAEKLAINANPLALVAPAQASQDPFYQSSRSHRSQAPSLKPSISSRSHTSTRQKGKEIAKPITPPSDTASEEDNDPEQAQRDKDMQKNLAIIAKYFKKIYKPTNNNLRTSSKSKNKNVDTTPREKVGSQLVLKTGIQCFNCKEYGHFAKECRKPKRVKDFAYHKEKILLCKQAEQGVLLQAEQYVWLADTDEEVDEQELEAHYSYMAKIQEVPNADSCTDSEPVEQVQNNVEYNVFTNELQHSEQFKFVSNTCLVEADDSNVTPNSPDMCEDDIQNEQNDVESDDERVADANLIANLKLDADENKKIQKQLKKANTTLAQELKECKAILAKTSKSLGESISVRVSCLVALQTKQTKFEKYKAFNDRTVDYDKLKRKLNKALGQIAHKDTVIREGLKTKAYELSVVKEKQDELMKQNMYDVILHDCVSKDVMSFYLQSISDLDAVAQLQCQRSISSITSAGMVKQYQNEVNELHAEKLAINANPLALVAPAQASQDPFYQSSRSHRSQAPSLKPSISSRSHTSTRQKGKEIAKPITPPSDTASEEDSDPEQAQRDKDMQKNLAIIAKYFKKIYKPTNNNLRTSLNSKNKNVDTTPRYKNDDHSGQFGTQRAVDVADTREKVGSQLVLKTGIQCFNCKEYGHFAKECRKPKRVKDFAYHKEKMLLCKQAEQGVPLQAEQYDWLADTDEEVDEQELEAHYNYMAKIQEVPNADSCTDSEPVEQNEQNDVESDDERVADANLIANLKLDTKQTKFEKYKAFNDRTVNYDKLKRKLNKALGQIAHKDTVIREDAVAQLQCMYLHKVKECDCLAQKLSKQTESVSKKIVQLILFIVDSGCTKHMTGNLKLLCNFVEKFLGSVHFGNDQFAPILGYGYLVQGNVTINKVAFRKSTCFTRDLQGNDLLTGNRGSDLYTISLQESTSSTPLCLMLKATPTQACKAERTSFKPKAVPSSKGRLNLLHMDLCGPMRIASINGKKYIMRWRKSGQDEGKGRSVHFGGILYSVKGILGLQQENKDDS